MFSGGATPSYVSLDYRAQEGFIYRIARDSEEESSLLKKLLASRDSTIVSEFGGKRIVREPVPIAKEEPLKLELQHFASCVRRGRRRWSAASPRAAPWTWPSKSPGALKPVEVRAMSPQLHRWREASHEPLELPAGFGLRRPPGAFKASKAAAAPPSPEAGVQGRSPHPDCGLHFVRAHPSPSAVSVALLNWKSEAQTNHDHRRRSQRRRAGGGTGRRAAAGTGRGGFAVFVRLPAAPNGAGAGFFGAGGPRMRDAGVQLAFDLTEHSVIGVSAVAQHYFKFRRFFKQLCPPGAGARARRHRLRRNSRDSTGGSPMPSNNTPPPARLVPDWRPKTVQYVRRRSGPRADHAYYRSPATTTCS